MPKTGILFSAPRPQSTDAEDKQVLSIEAQLQELRDYAKRENIEISAEIVEKQSAKIPGRPMFNNWKKTRQHPPNLFLLLLRKIKK